MRVNQIKNSFLLMSCSLLAISGVLGFASGAVKAMEPSEENSPHSQKRKVEETDKSSNKKSKEGESQIDWESMKDDPIYKLLFDEEVEAPQQNSLVQPQDLPVVHNLAVPIIKSLVSLSQRPSLNILERSDYPDVYQIHMGPNIYYLEYRMKFSPHRAYDYEVQDGSSQQFLPFLDKNHWMNNIRETYPEVKFFDEALKNFTKKVHNFPSSATEFYDLLGTVKYSESGPIKFVFGSSPYEMENVEGLENMFPSLKHSKYRLQLLDRLALKKFQVVAPGGEKKDKFTELPEELKKLFLFGPFLEATNGKKLATLSKSWSRLYYKEKMFNLTHQDLTPSYVSNVNFQVNLLSKDSTTKSIKENTSTFFKKFDQFTSVNIGSRNKLNQDFISKLIRKIDGNTTLSELNFYDKNIQPKEETLKNLWQVMKSNKTLKKLSFWSKEESKKSISKSIDSLNQKRNKLNKEAEKQNKSQPHPMPMFFLPQLKLTYEGTKAIITQ